MIRDPWSQPGNTLKRVRNTWSASSYSLFYFCIVEIKVLTLNMWQGDIVFISERSVWTFHPFSHVSSRWRAASLGSDPHCVPVQWSSRPQKALDPPACSTGRRKGACEKAWTNGVFRLLESQVDESPGVFCVLAGYTQILKGSSVNHIWLKAESALLSVGLKFKVCRTPDRTQSMMPQQVFSLSQLMEMSQSGL